MPSEDLPSYAPALPSRLRRVILALGLAPFVSGRSMAESGSSTEPVRIEWEVPAERLLSAQTAVGFASAQIHADEKSAKSTKGLPLLYILSGVVLLPELAKGLVDVYKEWAFGSTIVDATDENLIITHDPKGSSDVVIVKGSDGQTTVYDNRKTFDATKWAGLISTATRKSSR
jgi:hypothetical protein